MLPINNDHTYSDYQKFMPRINFKKSKAHHNIKQSVSNCIAIINSSLKNRLENK